MRLGLGAKVTVGLLVDVWEWILDINYATLEVQHRYKLSSSFMVVGELWLIYGLLMGGGQVMLQLGKYFL